MAHRPACLRPPKPPGSTTSRPAPTGRSPSYATRWSASSSLLIALQVLRHALLEDEDVVTDREGRLDLLRADGEPDPGHASARSRSRASARSAG